ncbi:MAG: FAD-dependent oxidoreductase [Azoarcus sp.]|nr:FAD-dependent oxidoreductase [Azoarcus sp.]
MLETVIIGGGLNGLALANLLHGARREFALFEARDRLGGRVLGTAEGHDLGPTWFWPDHQPRITRLVADLGLTSFPQWETGSHLHQQEAGGKPSVFEQTDVHGGARRLAGGMRTLIDALAARLPSRQIHLGQALTGLRDRGSHIEIYLSQARGESILSARNVVLAMPPRLVEEHVAFDPQLAARTRLALRNSPTWMAAQAKLITTYPTAFWRRQGYSGTATARHTQTVLAETWDAGEEVGSESGRAALGAFLALSPTHRDDFRAGLEMLAVSQLGQLFGTAAHDGERHYHDWAEEPHTCSVLDRSPPLAHPEYGDRELQHPSWQGKLHFGSTETAAYGGGYLEGALEAAGRIRRELSLGWTQAA